MKAAIRRSYGSPKVISVEDIAQPIPKEDELLIRVHATTVNRTDCANLTAKPFIMRFLLGLLKPRKIILGTDFAGEIVGVGKDVTSFQVNERVFGFTDMGLESQAEYIVITPKDNLLTIPAPIDYQQAVSSLEGAHYAYTFIHKTSIQPGHRVLINGASGGIGSALLQFTKAFDVHVTATCDTKNVKLIHSLGADKIIDYTQEDFTQDDEKYDFIFDAVGKSTFGKCKPLLKKGGIYISSELGPYSQNIFFAIFPLFTGDKKVLFPIPYSLSKTLPYIKSMLESGKFKPVIDREYSIEAIADAYTYVISGQKTGNVVINL
jgi:NADPH:quinone reductase-like Zn-dependent oxidoreductase